MPERKITVNGDAWEAAPSGLITQYDRDEFGIIFTRIQEGPDRDKEQRVTRYSPMGSRSRERSFAEMTDDQLRALFEQSQSSVRSPEIGYAR